MSNQFLDRRRRVLPLVIAGAAALLVFVAVGVAIESALSPHKAESYTPPAAVAPPGSVTGVNPSGTSAVGIQGPLKIVQGSQLINGVHIGFTHSSVGAVSAAVEYWTQIGSTLDPDRAAAIGRLVADPSWTQGPAQLAQGPVSTRKALGLPTTGAAPTGASVVLEPVEYQLRSYSADDVSLLLLADYTTTAPNQGSQTHLGVFPLDLRWSVGDWKILAPSGSTDYSNLAVEPGSAQASADGWQQLQQ
ncbi:MAG TPA: hypothetical protein VGS97_27800 [Actinocrinis sp.]|uniref:hypothetical protein n=1 Tax=Actinocrinis sp. TaxID=1920516 RepID=UPI002DDD5E23|nr:hypothetical protein [Actinocrinis sp.]HEV2347923.1 hypothetical protein [Actinocrinis sp.]